ncbi:MAG: hypothetical protein IID33_16315 [Planctomycetes bacterium]|nr:hypothetical protein [Planctomycetota bacterium]
MPPERNPVTVRMSDADRKRLLDASKVLGVSVSALLRDTLPEAPWPQAFAEFLRMLNVPKSVVSPTDVMAELSAIGLRQVMVTTPPRLRPADLDNLDTRDVAVTFLRWRRAIDVAVAETNAQLKGKALAGDVAMVPWRLETVADGYFRLVRKPATEAEFAVWLKASGFAPKKLDALQQDVLRGQFERERDQDSAQRMIEGG